MKIGLGIITFNRQKHKELCEATALGTAQNVRIYIAEDTNENRRGVAYRSNECLKALRDCDYIFLANDDIVFLKTGWAEFFINAHKASGQHHFLYLKETPTIKYIGGKFVCHDAEPTEDSLVSEINIYNNCAGCFMFLTKEAIEKVGAFDERFNLYGFEHANYSKRVHLAGLNTMGEYLCPAGASEYIYSMDLQNDRHYNKLVNHKSSMSVKETLECINKGAHHFAKPIEEIYIPL